MNAVGIDVSKGKSMVAIMRPFGEIVSAPFEIKHTASDIHSLVELINSVEGESRIVMEHTGRYYEVLAHHDSGLTFNRVDEFYKRIDITGCVFDFKRCGNNFTERSHDSNHTFTF